MEKGPCEIHDVMTSCIYPRENGLGSGHRWVSFAPSSQAPIALLEVEIKAQSGSVL